LALDRLGLRDLLRHQALALEHVHEVHVAAEVQLDVLSKGTAILEQPGQDAMVMVEPTWLLMSSPEMAPARMDRRAHSRSLEMNTGMQFTKAAPASRAAWDVVLGRDLGPHGKVVHTTWTPAWRRLPADVTGCRSTR